MQRIRLLVCATLLLFGGTVATASAWEWPLRGYWGFSEGGGQVVHDWSGMGNDGRIGRRSGRDASDAQWIRGVFGLGSALRFDGDDFVVMPDTESLRPQHVTVTAWVRADRQPGDYRYIVSKGGDRCEAGSFGLYTSENGGLAFYVYDGRHWYRSPQKSPSIWDGDWHFVAGSYDGDEVRLYVDGRQVGSGREFGGRIEYDLPVKEVYIGAYRGSCDLTFPGDVDEVTLWSMTLTGDDLREQLSGALSRWGLGGF